MLLTAHCGSCSRLCDAFGAGDDGSIGVACAVCAGPASKSGACCSVFELAFSSSLDAVGVGSSVGSGKLLGCFWAVGAGDVDVTMLPCNCCSKVCLRGVSCPSPCADGPACEGLLFASIANGRMMETSPIIKGRRPW